MPDLTIAGSPTFNGDSTCSIDSTGSDSVRGSDAGLSAVSGWVAARLKPTWASTDTGAHRFFGYGPDTNNEVFAGFTNTNWSAGRDDITGGGNVAFAASHAINDDITMIFQWSATQVQMSEDGASLVSAANTRAPDVSGVTEFQIGNRSYASADYWNGAFHWFLMGSGVLTNADCTTIHGFGNTDPAWSAIPGTPTFLWYAESANYLDADPAATAGPALRFTRSNLTLA